MWKPLKLAPWFIALGVSWSLGYVYNVIRGGGVSWIRATYENKMALASQIQSSHRILLVGGSGVHHSVNSELMEAELGVPVFNLGLDGKIGLNVIFPSVLPQVRQGDIVLLIPEYLMLLDEDGFGEISTLFGVAIGQPGLGDVPVHKLVQDTWTLGIPSLRSLVKSGVDLATEGKFNEYYADPITQRGDATKTWPRSSEWWALKINQPASTYSLQKIAEFRDEVEARGGTVILSLSWIYGSRDPETLKNVSETAAELAKIAPVIYDPASLNIITDSDLFADTHYHLKPKGREMRSEQLVNELRPILASLQIQQAHLSSTNK